MSNAMKKLKILHHLTAASASHPPSHSSAAAQPTPQQQQQHHHHHHHHQQQFPTPPASPVPPQATTTRQHYLSDARYRSDVLRSARAALYSLQGSNSPYLDPSCPHPQPSHNTMGRPPTQCLLPGGFMILTPASSYDNTPGLCVPASPPPASMAINPHGSPVQNSVPRGNTTIYSSRPPVGSPSPKPSPSYQHLREQSRPCSRPPARPRLKLTKETVAKIGKDSRLARWERVLGYVREQRSNTLPGAAAASPSSDGYASLSGAPSASPPSKTIDRKRRAEQIATIEAQNHILDAIDLEEQDQRSLWSGGSGGTNGVDEFMWSEDEDDDIRPAPKAPPPQKIFPEGYVGSTSGRGGDVNDEGIFECEMQVDEYLQQPPTRLSTPSTPQDRKRARPRSSPEEIAFQRVWGKRIVEEMSVLCRESELEGGLGRLMGRRMSAAY